MFSLTVSQAASYGSVEPKLAALSFEKLTVDITIATPGRKRQGGGLPVLLLCLYVNFSKNSFSWLRPYFLAESGCKSTTKIFTLQAFQRFFSEQSENFLISLQIYPQKHNLDEEITIYWQLLATFRGQKWDGLSPSVKGYTMHKTHYIIYKV